VNMSPKRIQLRRTKGYRKPEGAVVVSRPSIFGNPFRIDHWEFRMDGESPYWCCASVSGRVVQRFHTQIEAREKAVEMFRQMLTLSGEQRIEFLRQWAIPARYVAIGLEALRGKDLACWCAVGEPCHADVLLEIANK
jgi:hypothetical protein